MIDIFLEITDGIELKEDIIEALKATIIKAVSDDLPNHLLEVSVTITNNEGIRTLNAEYRGKNTPTDVLSFPMYEFDSPDKLTILGDIVISAERAKEQAEEYNHSFIREICFLAAHGALHLLGYDHEQGEEERLEMEKRQNEILNSLNITRDI